MFLSLLFFSLILGALIGSFLNVVIYRYGSGKSIATGRSECLSCGHTLSWLELIPVFSYIAQKGKCRNCGTPLSMQYPLVEIASAILFALVFIRQYNLYPLYTAYQHGILYSSLFALYYFCIVSMLLVIAVYDMRHKIIPEPLVYWFIGLSLVKLIIFLFFCTPAILGTSAFSVAFSFPYIFDLLAPVLFFVPFWLLWLISGGTWIGLGDAKLSLGIGALLGFVYGISAIVLGFWIGALFCIALLIMQHFSPGLFDPVNGKTELPLAPFLILGVFIVLFCHVDVLGVAQFFNV